MKRMLFRLALATCASMSFGSQAFAEPPQQPAAEALFGGAGLVATDDLAAITGRADTAMAVRAENSSTVAHNSVTGQSQTGAINFDGQSFQGLAGLSLLSANTGNNVSINSSLNVNVAIQR